MVVYEGGYEDVYDKRYRFRCKFTLAYAVTVDKAQGSQFPDICVVIDPKRPTTLPLLYTGVSRAQKKAWFVTRDNAACIEKATRSMFRPRGILAEPFDHNKCA